MKQTIINVSLPPPNAAAMKRDIRIAAAERNMNMSEFLVDCYKRIIRRARKKVQNDNGNNQSI